MLAVLGPRTLEKNVRVTHSVQSTYRGTSLIRNTPLLGPHSRGIYLGS